MGKMVNVTNRNNGFTGYTIPDTGITRSFNIDETKKIDIEELKQLQYVPGGEYLLKHFLVINDKSALEVLNMEDVEPEYFYTRKEVEELLKNGSIEQLEDALNFAPEGVIDLIKDIAIKTELPDTRKRKLISEKTGLNIDSAIMINTIMAEEVESTAEPVKKRKAAPIEVQSGKPTRKAPAPAQDKYKIVG